MEDRLRFIYDNSFIILKLLKKRELTCTSIKKMIFNGNDSDIRQMVEKYKKELTGSSEFFDNYLDSQELVELLVDKTFLSKKKGLLEDMRALFYSYYLVEEGMVKMDSKKLLLEKFLYLFTNSEVITDFMDLSTNNLTSNTFGNQQLESLLLGYKYLIEDENCTKIENYKRLSDNISSYDIVHRIEATTNLLDSLKDYVESQKTDSVNKHKKLAIIQKYYQLLECIRSQEIVQAVCLNHENKSKPTVQRLRIACTPSMLRHISLPSRSSLCTYIRPKRTTILRDVNDKGVLNNIFINANTLTTITTEDKNHISDEVKREKRHVKVLGFDYYYHTMI